MRLFSPAEAARRAVAAVDAAGPHRTELGHRERVAAFVAVLRKFGEPGPLTGVAAERPALDVVLEELRAILRAPSTAESVALLNDALARRTTPLRLETEPGADWHLHADPPPSGWADWFAAASLVGLAMHLAAYGPGAWGPCAVESCRSAYVRGGPGRPRTTCSAGCATLLRQQRFRARHRT